METKLPVFGDPPVVEVALSVQFEPLRLLRTPQLGLLWDKFRARFPKTEEHAPLESIIERFGTADAPQQGVRIQMVREPPVPRCWFVNEAGTELIQIQQDRFVRNWRKLTEEEAYPRYEAHIRPSFERDFRDFERFVNKERIGEVKPNQCEVTYVNHMVSGRGWEDHGDLEEILTAFRAKYTEEFLPKLEKADVSVAYVIPGSNGEPLGRLHISATCAHRKSDSKPIVVLNLVSRGRPLGEGIAGVMSFLDLGRTWIVRGFAAITTPKMQKVWGRTT